MLLVLLLLIEFRIWSPLWDSYGHGLSSIRILGAKPLQSVLQMVLHS